MSEVETDHECDRINNTGGTDNDLTIDGNENSAVSTRVTFSFFTKLFSKCSINVAFSLFGVLLKDEVNSEIVPYVVKSLSVPPTITYRKQHNS
jgi:hypothetical protein